MSKSSLIVGAIVAALLLAAAGCGNRPANAPVGTVADTSEDDVAKLQAKLEALTKPADAPGEFFPLGRTQRIGNVELTPIEASIGLVDVVAADERTKTVDSFLQLKFTLRNVTTNKRVQFDGFNQVVTNGWITDEHENRYKSVTFGVAKVVGDAAGTTIEPGQTVTAILVCEKPVDAATQLDLNLSGEGVGSEKERIRIRLTRDQWAKVQ